MVRMGAFLSGKDRMSLVKDSSAADFSTSPATDSTMLEGTK